MDTRVQHIDAGAEQGATPRRILSATRVDRAVRRVYCGLSCPRLAGAAGPDGGEAGDVLLLEAAGADALPDHGALKKGAGREKESKHNKNESRKRQKRAENECFNITQVLIPLQQYIHAGRLASKY